MTPYDPSKIPVSTRPAEENAQEKSTSMSSLWKIGGGAVVLVVLGSLLSGPLLHHAPQIVSAASLPSDTDLELKGTYTEDQDTINKFVAKGRITNTGLATAPVVEIDAVGDGYYHENKALEAVIRGDYDPLKDADKENNAPREPAQNTIIVDTLRNLRPGETRDFDYPIDMPRSLNGRQWLIERMSVKAHVKP